MRQDLDTKEANIENLKQQRLILDQKRLSKQVKETAKQTPGKSEAFLNYLTAVGADNKQRDLITKKLEAILTTAECKFDDAIDFVIPMGRLEDKLKNIFNQYKIEDKIEAASKKSDERMFETLLKMCDFQRKEIKNIERQQEDKRKEQESKDKMTAKNNKKNNMMPNQGRRENGRSEKLVFEKKKVNKDTADPEEIDYQRYLQQPFPQELKDKKKEEKEYQEAQQQLQKESLQSNIMPISHY